MIGTLRQIIDDMGHGIYDFTKDGKCIGCGACCSNYLPLSDKEIMEIRRYMKKNHIKEQKHIYPTINPVFDMTCPFLNESGGNKKCTIYEVRGEICRSFVCNDLHGTRANERLLNGKRHIVDMRETFFN